MAVSADLAAVSAGLAAVGTDPYVVAALAAAAADLGEAVGAMLAALLADYFAVGAGITVAADVSAIGANLTAIGADPDMLLALAAVSADILAVIAGALAFGAELGAIIAELALRAVVIHTFKALEAIHTVGALAALRQTLAAFGAVALVVSGTLIAELALLAEFIAQALGAGVTFLTVWRAIAGDKAGAAILAGSLIFQMADQAGRAALVAGTAAAVVKASEAQLTQFSVAMAGTAVLTVAAGGTVQAFLTFVAPLLNAIVTLKAAAAENRHLQKELDRKEKALAEAVALLVLRKKANAIWGDPEDE